jgi:hypothetical protein
MTKSIIKISILLSGIFLSAGLAAQEENDSAYLIRGNIGLLLGTDIGGAVPVPVSNIPGTINAYPQINPTLGVGIFVSFAKKWGMGMEVSYKTVAMKADARVNNQRFNMDNATMYFTGTARTEMKFIMLEIPLYVAYHLNSRNFVFTGPYYSHIFSGNFIADPVKGYSGSNPDIAEITDISDITMDFSQYTDKWDMGIMAGFGHTIFDRLKLTLRMSFGFKDIFKVHNNYFDYSMHHIRGGITLTYDFIKNKNLSIKK